MPQPKLADSWNVWSAKAWAWRLVPSNLSPNSIKKQGALHSSVIHAEIQLSRWSHLSATIQPSICKQAADVGCAHLILIPSKEKGEGNKEPASLI